MHTYQAPSDLRETPQPHLAVTSNANSKNNTTMVMFVTEMIHPAYDFMLSVVGKTQLLYVFYGKVQI